MTEPSQVLSIYVTIKTHWINTQAGTAISTIHSLSRPLPLTFENFCPAVLFALWFPFTFSPSKMLYRSVFFSASEQPMTVWRRGRTQTAFNSLFLHFGEVVKGRKRIVTLFFKCFMLVRPLHFEQRNSRCCFLRLSAIISLCASFLFICCREHVNLSSNYTHFSCLGKD